jgi:predicted DNA-binding transcriptional regulator AlpA
MDRRQLRVTPEPNDDATLAVLQPDDAILRMSAVRRRTRPGRSTISRLVSANQFPAPVRLTGRVIGWRWADIERRSRTLVVAVD